MTKLESAEKIIKQEGSCLEISCSDCCISSKGNHCLGNCIIEECLKLALKYKKEHEMKFKVGDKVKWNGRIECFSVAINKDKIAFLNSKKEHIISYIENDDDSCILMNCPHWFCLEWLEKVEEEKTFPYNLKKGDKIEVSNFKEFDYSYEEEFITYEKRSITPFVTIDNYGYINSYSHARKPIPKYKPYTQPKIEWVKDNLHLKNKVTGKIWTVIGICFEYGEYALRLQGANQKTRNDLKSLYELFELVDGTPFGELIK